MLKQYVKLSVLINIFFLFYALGIAWEESQVSLGSYYGGFFAWTFLPAFFFFLVFYGCYSYLKTNKIFLPNLLLMLFLSLHFFIFYLGLNIFDYADFALFKRWLSFAGISVFCGLIVKLILWLKNRTTKDDASS